MINELKECPFCGGTNTEIVPQTMWTGHKTTTYAYTLRHWCDFGVMTEVIMFKAKGKEELIKLWNTRKVLND